jgi:integrase/recombinase XerD
MSADLSSIVFDAVQAAVARPKAVHLSVARAAAEFRRVLVDRGRSERHARDVQRHVRRVCHAAGVDWIADFAEEAVVRGIARLRRRRKGRGENATISASTANHYRHSVRAFSRWLWQTRRLPENPLDRMAEFREDGPGRRRRELSVEEVAALVAAAERGPRVEGMHGPDRAWLYRVAVATGLRRGELSSLTPESFEFAGGEAAVVVAATFSKRRRAERQPLPPSLAAPLQAWLAGKPKRQLVWPMTKAAGGAERMPSRMVMHDLAQAGIPYRTEAGVADFHALRVAYVSWLVRLPNVSPKVVQRCARHSTITLTLDVYAKCGVDEVAAAVAGLPTPGGLV